MLHAFRALALSAFQLLDQLGDAAGGALIRAQEGNARPKPSINDRNATGNAEREPVGFEINLYLRTSLKVDGRRFDEASGKAEVGDGSGNPEPGMRQKYLGAAFAGETGMLASFPSESGLSVWAVYSAVRRLSGS